MSTLPAKPDPAATISVPIGRWAVASAPTTIRTLLGSCLGVVLSVRRAKIGGLAHIVLPDSRGSTDYPGKYANTAIPALILDLERLAGEPVLKRLTAKLLGGASMFHNDGLDIGRLNAEAVERILAGLGITVLTRDLGGEAGRRLTFDTLTGIVAVKIPGGADYEV